MTDPHAFLSYSQRYADWARVLHRDLEKGLDGRIVFIDTLDIGIGRPAQTVIQAGLSRAQHLILLTTPEALASPWVDVEWNAFVTANPDAIRTGRLLVAKLVDAPLPPFAGLPQAVDFTDPAQYAHALRELLGALCGHADRRNPPQLPVGVDGPGPLPPALDRTLRTDLVDWLAALLADQARRRGISSSITDKKTSLDGFATNACAASAALVLAGKKHPSMPAQEALRLLDIVAEECGNELLGLDTLRQRVTAELQREQAAVRVTAPADPLAPYRDYLRDVHARLVTFFPEAADQTLDQVHVDIDIERLAMHAVERKESEALPPTLEGLMRHTPDVATGITGRWLVMGEPGAGKSTIARHLAYRLAGSGAGPTPVYVSLARCAAHNRDPFDLVRDDLEGCEGEAKANAEAVAAHLRNLATGVGKAEDAAAVWLFLDGLDEVSKDLLKTLLPRLHRWSAMYRCARIAVMSRPIERLELGHGFPRAQLRKLDSKRQLLLLGKWLGQPRAKDMFDRIQARAQLAALAGNPLLLTLIAQVAMPRTGDAEPRELPGTRIALYRQAIDTLLLRAFKDAVGRAHEFDLDAARATLQELALVLQTSDLTAWTRGQLKPAYDAARSALAQRGMSMPSATVDAFLSDVSDVLPHDGSEKVYTFLHRQFREFLAAEALHQRGHDACLERVRALREEDLPRWSEVFGLLCGLFASPVAFLREIAAISRPLAMRALPDVEGLAPDEMLEFFGELTPDELWQVVASWGIDDDEGRARAAECLYRLVSSERSTDELAYLYSTMERIGRPPDRTRFFAQCDRPIERAPAIDWADIPAGEFVMGAAKSEWDDERPQHRVTVPAFRLAKTTITRAQYRLFDSHHKPTSFKDVPADEIDRLPITHVTWWEGWLFCRWIGGRLPSEDEWEYACRAGTTTEYWSGDVEADLKRVGWYSANSKGRPHAVGDKVANPWGLHDMHGNVWEWCADRWHSNYEGAPADGSAWEEGPSGNRVRRGGSFVNRAADARSAYHRKDAPAYRWRALGFRPAGPS